jgi:hypothetical protein
MVGLPDPKWVLDRTSEAVRLLTGAVAPAVELPALVAATAEEKTRTKLAASQSPAATQLRRRTQLLLEQGLMQSTLSATIELYNSMLDQLVSDEVRILAAMSGGKAYPLVHVYARTGPHRGSPLLKNACLVGRMANVALPRVTPWYVTHLIALGLVETGPEDKTQEEDYQILQADLDVIAAIKEGSRGPVNARVERHMLTMSRLGEDFWAAAAGE